MRNSHAKHKQTTLFDKGCNAAERFGSVVSEHEILGIVGGCENPLRENIVTCKDEYLHEFVEEVDGLDFNITLSQPHIVIPKYIPVFDRKSFELANIPQEYSVVGVTLRDALSYLYVSKNGIYHEPTRLDFLTDLIEQPVFQGKKVLLFLTGPDSLIETAWHERYDAGIYESIAALKFDMAVGFNFSLFHGECPLSHALNLKKSLYSCLELNRAGVPFVIPHVYILNQYHLQRWISWFKQNSQVKSCAMNCQMQKSDADICETVEMVSRLLLGVPNLNIILQGFHFDHLHRFGFLLDRIHVADATAIKYAHNKRVTPRIGGSTNPLQASAGGSFNELALFNIHERHSDLIDITKAGWNRRVNFD